MRRRNRRREVLRRREERREQEIKNHSCGACLGCKGVQIDPTMEEKILKQSINPNLVDEETFLDFLSGLQEILGEDMAIIGIMEVEEEE